MRTVVSYDDITTTQYAPSQQLGPHPPSSNQPPSKKRKVSQHKPPQKRGQQQQQHWDDPGNNAETMDYGESGAADGTDDVDLQEEEESRDLTHEEIWDDSALIEAWNSATAEYEAYHGKGKDWKKEPVKKSPLWYNVPPEKAPSAKDHAAVNGTAEDDSTPINFNTYIPTHDPSLAGVTAAAPASALPVSPQYTLSDPSGSNVSADEAFQKALSATYWAGYWTAIYHCQSRQQSKDVTASAEEEQAEAEADGPDDEEGDEDMSADLLTTQR